MLKLKEKKMPKTRKRTFRIIMHLKNLFAQLFFSSNSISREICFVKEV